MKHITKYLLIGSAALLWACEPSVDSFTPSSGTADFSTYVAVGDSYTAGYTDGALSAYGQDNSFANIISTQLKSVGGQSFSMPLIPETKSIGSAGNGSYKLVATGNPASPLAPVPTEGNMELLTQAENWVNGIYSNVGVPGAKSFHLLTPALGNPNLGLGNFNPFYTRFASKPGESSVLMDAMANQPTFFTLWIGANDVLAYALAGGEAGEGLDKNDITPLAQLSGALNALLSTLKSQGAEGALANIPDVNAIPYFSYIQYNAMKLDAATAGLLNQAYATYNQYAEAMQLEKMVFAEGNNAFVIADAAHPLKMRQIKEGEKVLLGASTNIQGEAGWGSKLPIPESYTLDIDELAKIELATKNFNEALKAASETHEVAFVDMAAKMEELKAGLIIDGHRYTATFITGGAFSLDGIHMCCRGSAIIANTFIDAINDKYNASVPRANINDYDGVRFP